MNGTNPAGGTACLSVTTGTGCSLAVSRETASELFIVQRRAIASAASKWVARRPGSFARTCQTCTRFGERRGWSTPNEAGGNQTPPLAGFHQKL